MEAERPHRHLHRCGDRRPQPGRQGHRHHPAGQLPGRPELLGDHPDRQGERGRRATSRQCRRWSTQTVGQAKQILNQAGFTNIQFEPGSDQSDTALVQDQDPDPGQQVDDPAGTTITLNTVGFNNGGNNNGGGDNGGGGIFGGVNGASARTRTDPFSVRPRSPRRRVRASGGFVV